MSDPGERLVRNDAGRPVVDGVLVVEATWLRKHRQPDDPDLWFWDCPKCECAFGPLTLREHAEQQALKHAAEDHNEGSVGMSGDDKNSIQRGVDEAAGQGQTNDTNTDI